MTRWRTDTIDETENSLKAPRGYMTLVSLTAFRSNLELDQNLLCSDLKCAPLITMKFCAHHTSVTDVWLTQFLCDRPNILWTRALQSSLNFEFDRNVVSGTQASRALSITVSFTNFSVTALPQNVSHKIPLMTSLLKGSTIRKIMSASRLTKTCNEGLKRIMKAKVIRKNKFSAVLS